MLLEYTGPVDYKIIDLLLNKMKLNKGFIRLDKITGKRTYAVVVECLENIAKHSVQKSQEISDMHPGICVSSRRNEIIITAGNPIQNINRNKLSAWLDHINRLNETELKSLYETRINQDRKPEHESAGLGLISMAIKSGSKISYKFNPLVNGYMYFEMQISLIINKS